MKGSTTVKYLTFVLEKHLASQSSFTIHVDRLISNDAFQDFRRPFNRESCKKYLDRTGPIGSAIVNALANNISGIEKICISSFSISIELGMAFDLANAQYEAIFLIMETIEPTFNHLKKSRIVDKKHLRRKFFFTQPTPSFFKPKYLKVARTIKEIKKKLLSFLKPKV